MPAASEPGGAGRQPRPALPCTWRPLGPRIAGLVAMGALVVVGAGAWLTFEQSVRDAFTLFQRGTVLALALLALATINALVRSRVVARTEGLTVINGYRRHQYAWEQIVGVHLAPGAPWLTLDLSDGSSVAAMGIQGSDGARARKALRDLRLLVDG